MFDSKKEYVKVGVTDAGYPIYMEKKEDKKMEKVSKKVKNGLKGAGKWIAAGVGAGLAIVGAVLVNAAKKKPADGIHYESEDANNQVSVVPEDNGSIISVVPDQDSSSSEDTSET